MAVQLRSKLDPRKIKANQWRPTGPPFKIVNLRLGPHLLTLDEAGSQLLSRQLNNQGFAVLSYAPGGANNSVPEHVSS